MARRVPFSRIPSHIQLAFSTRADRLAQRLLASLFEGEGKVLRFGASARGLFERRIAAVKRRSGKQRSSSLRPKVRNTVLPLSRLGTESETEASWNGKVSQLMYRLLCPSRSGVRMNDRQWKLREDSRSPSFPLSNNLNGILNGIAPRESCLQTSGSPMWDWNQTLRIHAMFWISSPPTISISRDEARSNAPFFAHEIRQLGMFVDGGYKDRIVVE